MWAGLQDRIDDRFTPLFDAEKNGKNLYELFIDRATILIKKIIFDIFHDTLPLNNYYIRVISIFLNDIECSLSNICYSIYCTNIT